MPFDSTGCTFQSDFISNVMSAFFSRVKWLVLEPHGCFLIQAEEDLLY